MKAQPQRNKQKNSNQKGQSESKYFQTKMKELEERKTKQMVERMQMIIQDAHS